MSRSTPSGHWDVVIAGAGPAGLSAALILGRARRRVLICDTGTPRSWASKAMHGFLSRDGVPPAEFLAIGRRELRRYANVKFLPQEVATAGAPTTASSCDWRIGACVAASC